MKHPFPQSYFSYLKKGLCEAIEDEKRKALENDVKIDALMRQHVFDYEQFSQMVKAAHLKVLSRESDKQLGITYPVDRHDLCKLSLILENVGKKMECNARILEATECDPASVEKRMKNTVWTGKLITRPGQYSREYASMPQEKRRIFLIETYPQFSYLFKSDLPPALLLNDTIAFWNLEKPKYSSENGKIFLNILFLTASHKRSKVAFAFIQTERDSLLQIIETFSKLEDCEIKEKVKCIADWIGE